MSTMMKILYLRESKGGDLGTKGTLYGVYLTKDTIWLFLFTVVSFDLRVVSRMK